MPWGGRRAGAGRPKKEISNITPSHSIRAKDDEWEVIKPFAMLVKMGYRHECWRAVLELAKRLDKEYPPEEDDEESFEGWFLRGGWK